MSDEKFNLKINQQNELEFTFQHTATRDAFPQATGITTGQKIGDTQYKISGGRIVKNPETQEDQFSLLLSTFEECKNLKQFIGSEKLLGISLSEKHTCVYFQNKSLVRGKEFALLVSEKLKYRSLAFSHIQITPSSDAQTETTSLISLKLDVSEFIKQTLQKDGMPKPSAPTSPAPIISAFQIHSLLMTRAPKPSTAPSVEETEDYAALALSGFAFLLASSHRPYLGLGVLSLAVGVWKFDEIQNFVLNQIEQKFFGKRF
jgi:hypothetical protein